MKFINVVLIISTLLFTSYSFANDDLNKEERVTKEIERMLSESNLSLKEKTEIQTLALRKIDYYNQIDLPSKTDVILESYDSLRGKALEYSVFTGALAVKIVEMSSEAGVEADKFIDDTWTGKIVLATVFFMYGGGYLIDILIVLILTIMVTRIFRYLTYFSLFNSFKVPQEFYININARRNFLLRTFSKNKTKTYRTNNGSNRT